MRQRAGFVRAAASNRPFDRCLPSHLLLIGLTPAWSGAWWIIIHNRSTQGQRAHLAFSLRAFLRLETRRIRTGAAVGMRPRSPSSATPSTSTSPIPSTNSTQPRKS